MNRVFLLLFTMFFLLCHETFSLPYDYSSTKSIPIKMNITEEISTKMPIFEGQTVKLRVIENSRYKGKFIVKKGDIISAKIGTIITAGMNGFPAEIILEDFEIPGVKESQLINTYGKTGQNRCLFVFPLKWALTFLPPTGSLTNFIMGGHAKIKTRDVITIYYYPEWL